MTPALLTLARQLAAVPGFPSAGDGWGFRIARGGSRRKRDPDGLLWVPDPDVEGPPYVGAIPDLTDPATGGVLLQMVGPCNVSRMTSGEWVILGPGMIAEEGATLAEACARVIVALGRVGDV